MEKNAVKKKAGIKTLNSKKDVSVLKIFSQKSHVKNRGTEKPKSKLQNK